MLLTGPLEPTSEAFAVAKIAGVRMCQAYNAQYGTRFLTAIPATVYGPHDRFDENSHVVGALIDRFHRAKEAGAPAADVWGTGRPRREFLYCDDAAEALILLARVCDAPQVVHVAQGEEASVRELAERIRDVVGYGGRIRFDDSKPDGMPRRQLEASAIRQLGWRPQVSLDEGLRRTYAWYLEHRAPSNAR
jgi:GDP-L-fucose synthase